MNFKNYCFLLLSSLFLIACSSDDSDDYIPTPIETNSVTAQVNQNESIDIDVLANDNNVPTSGVLTASNAANGSLQIIDPNNTPDNPSDDLVRYTPNEDYIGQDVFQYTICDDRDNCASNTVTVTVVEVSPVNYDLNAMPYDTLSEYNFFKGTLSDLEPVYGVLPYETISSLFTDYAKKKRYVWMPGDVSASYVSDYDPLDFPTGTILIKNFYYDNVLPDNSTQIIETRLMIKKETEWIFANYLWNESQTEATYDMMGSFVPIEWTQNGENYSTNYRIPSSDECFMCHKSGSVAIPIGPKPQNINKTYNYADGAQNQMAKLVAMGYLENNYPGSIETVVEYSNSSQDLEMRVRSYFDINCAHCHTDLGHCDYRAIRLAFHETDVLENMGVCVEPDTDISPFLDGYNPTHIVYPGDIEKSVLYFRLDTQFENLQMPLVGRSLIHQEAVDLVVTWINSLEGSCE